MSVLTGLGRHKSRTPSPPVTQVAIAAWALLLAVSSLGHAPQALAYAPPAVPSARGLATSSVPLPTACNIANCTSQEILGATGVFMRANAFCYQEFAKCKKNASATNCDLSCLSGEETYGRVCVNYGGHFCAAQTTVPASAATPAITLHEAICLPGPCTENLVPTVQAWDQDQNCGNLAGCTTTLNCDYGINTKDILGIVAVVVGVFAACAVLFVSAKYYRTRQRRMRGDFNLLMTTPGDDDDL